MFWKVRVLSLPCLVFIVLLSLFTLCHLCSIFKRYKSISIIIRREKKNKKSRFSLMQMVCFEAEMFWPVISSVCGDIGHTLCVIDYCGVTYLLMLVRTGNKNGRDTIYCDWVCLYSISPADVRNPFSVIYGAFEVVLRVSCVLLCMRINTK
jgi:hypothetical protein